MIAKHFYLTENVLCFTTTCLGGYSEAPFKSLNVAYHVGDKPELVAKNRQAIDDFIQSLSHKALPSIYMNQQHTTRLCELDLGHYDLTKPMDGILTSRVNMPLAVMTADCLPVVLTDGKKISAVHAGWRGLVDGIIEKAVACFDDTTKLQVWIGPAISQRHFEVGEEVAKLFDKYSYAHCNQSKNGKYLLDLKEICQRKLQMSGVSKIGVSDHCTYADDQYFSHRKATHEGQASTGRNATFILRVC
ncbi:peptidoglycan editing factor PgeF [Agaribacter flavus]|uniref:Purine nucleoside phosphorylase n=1 Tax=Agaribacter flavus TaxID=1902781 RepID=A0ABV7FP30_9ALTE